MTFAESVNRYDEVKRYRRRRNPLMTGFPPSADHCLSSDNRIKLTTALGLVRILDDLDIRECKHCEDLRFALLGYLKGL